MYERFSNILRGLSGHFLRTLSVIICSYYHYFWFIFEMLSWRFLIIENNKFLVAEFHPKNLFSVLICIMIDEKIIRFHLRVYMFVIFLFFLLDRPMTKNSILNTKCHFRRFILKKKSDSLDSSLFEMKRKQKFRLTFGIQLLSF